MLDACGEAFGDLVGIMTTRPSDQPDDISWSFAGRKSGNKSLQHLEDLNFEFNYKQCYSRSILQDLYILFLTHISFKEISRNLKKNFVSHVDFVKFISLITKQCHTQNPDVIESYVCIICYSSNNHVYELTNIF